MAVPHRTDAAPFAWEGGSPDDYVGWTLIQASHALGRHFEAALTSLGLTPMQFGVLVQLSLRPNLGSAELARLVLVTPQSMGSCCSRCSGWDWWSATTAWARVGASLLGSPKPAMPRCARPLRSSRPSTYRNP